MDELKRNGSGYYDPTAEKAIKTIVANEKKVTKLIKTIQAVAHLAGYEIEGRIVLRDKKSGEVWR